MIEVIKEIQDFLAKTNSPLKVCQGTNKMVTRDRQSIINSEIDKPYHQEVRDQHSNKTTSRRVLIKHQKKIIIRPRRDISLPKNQANQKAIFSRQESDRKEIEISKITVEIVATSGIETENIGHTRKVKDRTSSSPDAGRKIIIVHSKTGNRIEDQDRGQGLPTIKRFLITTLHLKTPQ